LPVAARQLHNCIWRRFRNIQNRKFPKNGKTQACAALPQISIFEKGNEDKLESRIFKLQNDFLYPPLTCADKKELKFYLNTHKKIFYGSEGRNLSGFFTAPLLIQAS
jgi:hypothetical protein